MDPRALTLALSTALCVGACAAGNSASSSPTPPTSAASKPIGPTVEWVTLGPRDGIALDVRYPHFYELRKGHDEPAPNRAIDAELTSLVDQFLLKAREARREGPASTGLAPWSFWVRCTPTYYRADAVSVVCKIDDYEGGAHPKQTAIALNFSPIGTAQTFSIDHMFLPGKNHRRVISDLCIAALARQKAQWVVDGLTDVTKFLHTVNVTATGLLVTFDPYETGPYAEGFHEVAIPWERVHDIIDPSGPIGAIGR